MDNKDEHTFTHIPTKEELLASLEDENDPKSMNYKRVLSRPKIHWVKALLLSFVTLLLIIGAGVGLYFLNLPLWMVIVFPIGILFLFSLLHGRFIIIFLVHVYQRYAPEYIRMRCRFEPSCSEYMILSLRKYGLFKGLYKGLNRLCRCKAPNGGYDEP